MSGQERGENLRSKNSWSFLEKLDLKCKIMTAVGLLHLPHRTSVLSSPGNLEQSPPGSAGHSLTAHNGPRSLHSQPGLGVARVGLDGFDLMYVYYFISSEDTDINHWTEGKEKKNNCNNF